MTTLATTRHGPATGDGAPIVLLHGWPHTHRVWDLVLPRLAADREVVTVDLPGLGESPDPTSYDGAATAAAVRQLIDELGVERVHLVAIDVAVPAAFLLAIGEPERIASLTLMESLLSPLPGAESFLAHGVPWWFGFHAVPGLPERVLAGHEGEYLDWFLTEHTYRRRGIPCEVRDAFVAAYTGPAMARGFEYYRAFGATAEQVEAAVDSARLTVPTLALGGGVVGDALAGQLRGVTDDLESHLVPECGHLVPLEQPDALCDRMGPFLARASVTPSPTTP